MTGVRWSRTTDGFEGRCEGCRDWWPITADFWPTTRGARACRACLAERARDASRRYRERRAVQSAAVLRHRERNREWMRAYRAQHREQAA